MTGSTQPSVKVLRQLSSDAQSEAFLAQVGGFPAPMVVRLVKPELAQDTARMNRFIADAQLLANVSSPALLQVRSAGRMNDGRVYVLTEFAEGESLAGKSQLQLEAFVDLGERLAEALKALHDSGVVLGALTAQQILLTGAGPKLDPSLASLTRAPGATAATDVQALARLLQAYAGPATEKNPFEGVRQGLSGAHTANDLLSAFGAARERWGGDTRVSAKAAVKQTEPSSKVPEPDLTGQRLGMYELHHLLGEGAMGRVYLGKHTRIGREAAIKVLKAEHAREKDLVQRFIQEATAVSAIKNEHIVEVHDFGEEVAADGSPRVYCVMEVLHGQSLAAEITRGQMSVQRACRIIQQVARALGAAHALGVVHRDVKPENIFLHQRDGDADYVKVLDFGVAKLLKPLANLATSSTQAGVIIGTPDYMAPEQALGISTDLRTDLYAVGLVLYELLAGHGPFRGETFGQLLVEITTTPPPPLPARTQAGEVMPPRVAEIVARCLQKKPEDRWKDAAELCAALEPFVHTGNTVPNLAMVRPLPPRSPLPWVAAAIAVGVLGAAAWFVARPAPVAPLPAPVVVAVAQPPVVPPEPVVAPVPAPVVEPAPAPAPAPAVRIPARLTGKDVARVFSGSQAKLRRCLQEHRKLLPSKEGQLMLTFTVLASGAVSQARVSTPGIEPVITTCVVARLKDLKFPRALEPNVTFELPLAYVFKD